MKRTAMSFIRRVMLAAAICLSLSCLFMRAPSASALPGSFTMVAAATGSCPLLDGTTGALQNDGRTCCPTGNTNGDSCIFQKYIRPLIELLSALVGMVVVIGILYGAFEITSSGGDPGKFASGRKRIIAVLIGLLSYIMLYAFLRFLIPGGL